MVAIEQLENGRTILTDDGVPVLVTLVTRESTTAPCRWKAALVVPVKDDQEVVGVAPLPFAQAVVAGDGEPNGWTPEWRMDFC